MRQKLQAPARGREGGCPEVGAGSAHRCPSDTEIPDHNVRGLRALEQAIDEHHWWAPYFNNSGRTQALRADLEFRRLMKRINFPDASL